MASALEAGRAGAEDALRPSASFLRRRRLADRLVRLVLFAAASLSVFVTAAIVYILISESLVFFGHVSLVDFLTDTQWTPLFANPRYGILPLLSGTLVVAGIALLVAIPAGTTLAIYLSEYAPVAMRETIKPLLELLAGVPTVVYGYFALLFVTPALQTVLPGLAAFNALSAGLVMGVMILPMVASLSEDALRGVPDLLREGSYALGATQAETILRVLLPAAFSGISAAVILAVSRAIGETMVVAIAAGLQPRMTLNPLEPIEAMTAYIVQVSLGDTPAGTIEYRTIFAVGALLFVGTFLLNVASLWLRERYREEYS
jgi:phosphate transport system permease protein